MQSRFRFREVFKRTIFCLIVYIIFTLLISHLIHIPEKLNPLTNKIDDFELSDLCFAYLHEKVPPDTNVYIINCSKDSIKFIADKISKVEDSHPKAIGLDMIFSGPAASKNAIKMMDTIDLYKKNIVLAVEYPYNKSVNQLSQYPFYQRLQDRNDGEGSFNWGYLKSEAQFDTKRYIEPFLKFNDTAVDAFSVGVIRNAYGSSFLNNLEKRANEEEVINYRNSYDVDRYSIFDTIPADKTIFKNKIVLFGDVDNESLLDLHYTPLNKYIGRSLPDMHGIIYHAQIISMIINADYIDEINKYLKTALIFCFCFLFMVIYYRLFEYHSFYHFFVDIIFGIITVPLSIIVCGWLLNSFKIKFEPTDYLIPIFFCGLALHLYEPVTKFLVRLIPKKFKKFNHGN